MHSYFGPLFMGILCESIMIFQNSLMHLNPFGFELADVDRRHAHAKLFVWLSMRWLVRLFCDFFQRRCFKLGHFCVRKKEYNSDNPQYGF